MVLKCHLSSVGSHKVRSFHISILLCHSPHSKLELGHHNFFLSFILVIVHYLFIFSELITLVFSKFLCSLLQ